MRFSILLMLGLLGLACGLIAQTAPNPRAGDKTAPARVPPKSPPAVPPAAASAQAAPAAPLPPAPPANVADKEPLETANGKAAATGKDPAPEPKYTDVEYHLKKSYAFGRDIARGIKADELEFDLAMIVKGLTEGLKDVKSEMTEQEHAELMQAIMAEIEAKAAAKHKLLSAENQKAAEKFLVENAKKEGIVVLPSGLQYRILKSGDGAMPKATESVQVHLKGTLLNGSVFVSTYNANQPTTFPVSRIIKGLREALLLMKKGDRWQIFVPAELAFGAAGNQAAQPGMPDVGPAELVIYEVELLEIMATVPE